MTGVYGRSDRLMRILTAWAPRKGLLPFDSLGVHLFEPRKGAAPTFSKRH